MATQTQFKAQFKDQFKGQCKIQGKRLGAIVGVTLGYLAVVPLVGSEVGRDGIAAAFGQRDRVPEIQVQRALTQTQTQTQTQNQNQTPKNQMSPPCDHAVLGSRTVQLAARSRGDGPWQAVVVLGGGNCTPARGVI